jgi:hypothetical protein
MSVKFHLNQFLLPLAVAAFANSAIYAVLKVGNASMPCVFGAIVSKTQLLLFQNLS